MAAHRILIPLLALACADPRVDALSARVAALEARFDPGPTTAVIDPETGVLVQVLDEAQVLGCVVEVTSQSLRALYAHEALSGEFTDDIRVLDWAPESPCRWYTATRILPFSPTGRAIEVEVLLTRGPARGRRFLSDLKDEPVEQAPLSAEALQQALAAGNYR